MNTCCNSIGTGQPLNNPSSHLMQYLKKRRFFWIAILHFVIIAIVVAFAVFMSVIFVDIIKGLITDPNLTWNSSISESQANVMATLAYVMPVVALVGSIPSIVTGIAYLVINLQSKKGKVPMVGVTILQVLSAIQLVSAVMLAFYAVIVGAVGSIAIGINAPNQYVYSSTNSFGTQYSMGMLIILVIVFVVVAAIYLAYAISSVMLSSKVKKILKNQTLVPSGATAVGVTNIISAVLLGVDIFGIALMLCAFGFGNEIHYTNTSQRVWAIVIFTTLLLLVCASLVLAILKAKAALGVKSHMKKYDGPVITPQPPTGYYGIPPYNQNGFGNADPYNGYYNNSYNNGGCGNQSYNAPPRNSGVNTNQYQR